MTKLFTVEESCVGFRTWDPILAKAETRLKTSDVNNNTSKRLVGEPVMRQCLRVIASASNGKEWHRLTENVLKRIESDSRLLSALALWLCSMAQLWTLLSALLRALLASESVFVKDVTDWGSPRLSQLGLYPSRPVVFCGNSGHRR